MGGNIYIFKEDVWRGDYWSHISLKRVREWVVKSLEGPSAENEGLITTSQLNLAITYITSKMPEREELFEGGNLLGVTDGFIPFSAGIYKISTQELLPHSPEFGFEGGLSASAPEDMKTPTFDKFMDEVCIDKGEVDVAKRQQLLEVLGLFASGLENRKAPYIICLTGDGGNGKGVFSSVVESLVGERVSAVSVKDLDSGNSTHSLKSSFVNIMDEMDASLNRNSWNTLKKLSSGDLFTVKKKYANDECIYPTAKVLIICNKIPSLSEENSAMQRRLRVFQFKNSFVGREDRFIGDRLRKEVPGIFYKAMESYRKFKERGYRFDDALSVIQASERHQATGREPYKLFFDDCLELTAVHTNYVSNEYLFKIYNMWSREVFGGTGTKQQLLKQAHNLKEYMEEQAVKDGSMPDVMKYNTGGMGKKVTPFKRRDVLGVKNVTGLFCVRLSTNGHRLYEEHYRQRGLAIPPLPRQSAPAESETAGRDNVVKIRV